MPNWHDILNEIGKIGSPHDVVRRNYLKKLSDYGVLAAEMEAAALYWISAKYNVRALGVFTVSNHILTGEETTQEERETSFNDMARIALDAIVLD